MLGECAKISAFIRAVPSNLSSIKSAIHYVGHGSARAAFFHPYYGPSLDFLLRDHKIREVVIGMPEPGSEQEEHRFTPLYRIRSDGVALGSQSWLEILEGAHEWAINLIKGEWNSNPHEACSKGLERLVALLSASMERVA